ncbi:hypothetical protein C8R46DRAFT_1075944 [Mycena filopes]|nr:hypothetical protein C8R46DRAFT_1075944 [Mycena filopes]
MGERREWWHSTYSTPNFLSFCRYFCTRLETCRGVRRPSIASEILRYLLGSSFGICSNSVSSWFCSSTLHITLYVSAFGFSFFFTDARDVVRVGVGVASGVGVVVVEITGTGTESAPPPLPRVLVRVEIVCVGVVGVVRVLSLSRVRVRPITGAETLSPTPAAGAMVIAPLPAPKLMRIRIDDSVLFLFCPSSSFSCALDGRRRRFPRTLGGGAGAGDAGAGVCCSSSLSSCSLRLSLSLSLSLPSPLSSSSSLLWLSSSSMSSSSASSGVGGRVGSLSLNTLPFGAATATTTSSWLRVPSLPAPLFSTASETSVGAEAEGTGTGATLDDRRTPIVALAGTPKTAPVSCLSFSFVDTLRVRTGFASANGSSSSAILSSSTCGWFDDGILAVERAYLPP